MTLEEKLSQLREDFDRLDNNPEAQRRVAMEIERLQREKEKTSKVRKSENLQESRS